MSTDAKPRPPTPLVPVPGQPVDRLALALRLAEQAAERLVRIETRLVILMRQHGLDPNGNPIE